MAIDIRVRIDEDERSLDSVDANWIHQHFAGPRATSRDHRVQVHIRTEHVFVLLTTYNCQSSGCGRAATREERQVLDLWSRFRLGEPGADLHKIWPFLRCLRNDLGLGSA